MQIGGYRIDPVFDGVGAHRPEQLFGDLRGEQWEPHRGLLNADGLVEVSIGGFLLRGHGRTLLVDLGFGPGELMGIRTGRLPGSLRDLGVTPEEVADVLFTHLHADHVGWAAHFPAATFHCGAADYRHFVVERRDPFTAERLAGCENRFESFPGAFPGITAIPAPGHTPGSTVLVISGTAPGSERAVLFGDVAHCPVQLLEDEWNTVFDVDPALARRTRARLVRELAGNPAALAVGAHFPGMRFGRLLLTAGRRHWAV